MKKVLIIGASSGIGRELALQYASLGYQVVALARRLDKLKEIASENISYDFIDINKVEDAILKIKYLIIDTDISIICAGIGDLNDSLDFNIEYETIKTNIIGFTAIVDTIFNYYKSIKNGHIVALSSIASIRGSDIAPAYNASKAYVSNYMEGLKKNP